MHGPRTTRARACGRALPRCLIHASSTLASPAITGIRFTDASIRYTSLVMLMLLHCRKDKARASVFPNCPQRTVRQSVDIDTYNQLKHYTVLIPTRTVCQYSISITRVYRINTPQTINLRQSFTSPLSHLTIYSSAASHAFRIIRHSHCPIFLIVFYQPI